MKVTYRVRPRDLLQCHLHLFNASMVGKIGYLPWLLLPVVMGGLPLLRVINPIAHPLAVLRHINQSVLITWLVISSVPYALAALSKMLTSVSITSRGFTMAIGSIAGGSKRVALWQQVKAVEQDAHYIYLRKFWYVLSVPKDAFPSSVEAESFFALALAYWREAKGIAPPAAPDVSGIWPPAPAVD